MPSSEEIRSAVGGPPGSFTTPAEYRGLKVPAGLRPNRWEYGFWTQGVDAALNSGEIENPFEEKPFIDRLIELIAGNEHSARTTDEESTADEIRTDIAELLGDRDDLADKITTEVEKLHPLCDGDEVNRGIYVALDFLFGAGPGTALPEPTTHLAAPGVIHSGDLSDCAQPDCVAYWTKQDAMRPEPTWSGRMYNGCPYCTGSDNSNLHDHILNVHPSRFAEWAGRES